MDAVSENTKVEAIDRALSHYPVDPRNREQIVEELSTEHVEAPHTPYLPLKRKTAVGREYYR